MKQIFLKIKVFILSFLSKIKTNMLKVKKRDYRFIASEITETENPAYKGKIVILDRFGGRYVKKNGVIHFFDTADEAKRVAMKLNQLK